MLTPRVIASVLLLTFVLAPVESARSAPLEPRDNRGSLSVPAPTGPNRVGTRVFHMVDGSRVDPFLRNGTRRELMVRFWYPRATNVPCRAAEYASPQVWARLTEVSALLLPVLKTNSCRDVPAAEGKHSVIVFDHGYTGTFTDATYLFEDLASRGYVVASIAHTYESTAVEFPDGSLHTSLVGSYLNGKARGDEESVRRALTIRLDDVRFVLAELGRLNAAGPFAQTLDLSRIGMMGYSLGGEAVLSMLRHDARVRSGVLLDAVISPESTAGTVKPVLMVTAGRSQWDDSECRLWTNLSGPRLAINVPGADHLSFSDFMWMASTSTDQAAPGATNAENLTQTLRKSVAAFFDINVRGLPATPLFNDGHDYPGLHVATRRQALCRDQAAHVSGGPQ